MKTTLASILAISALTIGVAQAEGLTVSVGAQQASTDIGAPRHDTQAAVGVGYDFGKVGPVNVEGQLNYVDLGRIGTGVQSGATDLSAVVSYPLDKNVSVFGRAGVANVRTGGASDMTNVLGVGLSYSFNKNWSAAVEAKRYGPRVHTYGATVKYSF